MKSSVKVGVILPSRGLMFSQTADEILQNVKDIPHKFFFSHRKPIPDCFEIPVNKALKDKDITHIWMVEDDMVLPPDALKRMLDVDLAVVTVDYPTTDYGGGAVVKIDGEIIFGGTGCTLIKREVFDELKKPYFRTDICWNFKNFGNFFKIIGVPRNKVNDGYGLHDVNFFINLYRKGIPVHDGGFTIGQRKLKALGKAGTNDGAHNIEVWTKIKKDDFLEKAKKWPVEPQGNLVSIVIEGKELQTDKKNADRLVKLGKAIYPPHKAVVIDDLEVL